MERSFKAYNLRRPIMQTWTMEKQPMTRRDMPVLVGSIKKQIKSLESRIHETEELTKGVIADWEEEITWLEKALKQLKGSVANPAKVDQGATSNLS